MKKFLYKVLEFSLIFIIAFVVSQSFKIAKVEGNSMYPTLKDGDVIVISALDKPDDLDVVVFSTEGKELKADYIVKRYYENKSNQGYFLQGDNTEHSTDSRVLGEFNEENNIGVVFFNLTSMDFVK